jgi:hypothetical protein
MENQQRNQKRLFAALKKIQVNDDEMFSVFSEAGKILGDQEIDKLIELIQQYGKAEEANTQEMTKKLKKIADSYRAALIAGRRRSLHKALMRKREHAEKKRTEDAIAKIKKALN